MWLARSHWKRLMKQFVLSDHAARDELLAGVPSVALRGAAEGARRLPRNIHKRAKTGQTPADTISGCWYNHLSSRSSWFSLNSKKTSKLQKCKDISYIRRNRGEPIFIHCVANVMTIPFRISPSCSGLLSGMPWQMTSLTDVQQDLGKL